MMQTSLLENAEALEPQIIAWRRDFHMHPELGFNEYRTRLEAQADADNWTTMRRYLASR